MSLLNRLSSRRARQRQQPQATAPASPPSRHRPPRLAPAAPDSLPDDFVISHLERQDSIPQAPRAAGEGDIHVSTLIDLCARQRIISELYPSEQLKPVSSADRVVWALGRAAEKHVRTQFIADRNREGIFGRWRCNCRRKTYRIGFYDGGAQCPRCSDVLDTYDEVALKDQELRIVGNPDLLFREAGIFYATEIKSINGDEFDELRAPKVVHVLQALLYRYLLLTQGFPASRKVIVIYVNKHYRFFRKKERAGEVERSRVYREFHVDVTQPMYRAEQERMLAVAEEVRLGIRSRLVPPRAMCDSVDCARAKDCPVAATCFNL